MTVNPPPAAAGLFPTTMWSVVVNAHAAEESVALQALDRLARAYWQPLHAFLVTRSVASGEAEDCVQSFFAHLISREILLGVERRETRFRTFLLTCFTRWLSNQRRDAAAQRRGGGAEHVPMEALTAHEEPGCMSAGVDALYDQHWARALYDHAVRQLDTEIRARGERQGFFEELRERVLDRGQAQPGWEEMARRHGMNPSSVRKAAHDLRQRFATLLRHEVRKVVAHDDEVDDELRHLIRLLAR